MYINFSFASCPWHSHVQVVACSIQLSPLLLPFCSPGSEVWWLAKISIWSDSHVWLLFCSQFLAKDTQVNSQMVVSQNPAVVCPAKVYSDVTSSVWYIGRGLTSQQSMVLALSPNECVSFCTQSFLQHSSWIQGQIFDYLDYLSSFSLATERESTHYIVRKRKNKNHPVINPITVVVHLFTYKMCTQ